MELHKHQRARNLKLSIGQDGSARLTIPYYLPYFIGIRFLHSKRQWLQQESAKAQRECSRPLIYLTEQERTQKRREAREIIGQLVKHYAALYGVRYNRIAIRDQKSLWGSCSAEGNLNFNWRITLAPQEVLHYVVVHEVCHLRELNHSKRFWQLVALSIPDHKLCSSWLAKQSRALHAV